MKFADFLTFALILIVLLYGLLPHYLATAIIVLLCLLLASLVLSPNKRSSRRSRALGGKTVAYIIVKDGYGKFGITTCSNKHEDLCVKRRYNNEPLEILWTKTLPSRQEAYRFEHWCKTLVTPIKGREWFNVRNAKFLAEQAELKWR